MGLRCSGVTRKGDQCSINSCSRLTDERGRVVAEPLRLGGAYCRFHARPFVTQCVEKLDGPAVLFFLDLEMGHRISALNLGFPFPARA